MNVHVHVWMLFQQASIPARRPDFQLWCSSHLSSWKFKNQNVCMQEFPAWQKSPELVPKSLAQKFCFLRDTAYTWIWAPGYSVSHSTTPFKVIIWQILILATSDQCHTTTMPFCKTACLVYRYISFTYYTLHYSQNVHKNMFITKYLTILPTFSSVAIIKHSTSTLTDTPDSN